VHRIKDALFILNKGIFMTELTTSTVVQKIQAILFKLRESVHAALPESRHDEIQDLIKEHSADVSPEITEALHSLADASYEHSSAKESLSRTRCGDFDSQDEEDEAIGHADFEWNYAKDALVDKINEISNIINED